MTRGQNSTWKFRPGVIIQCRIKTRGHTSTGVKILSVGGVVIQWTPVSGVAVQHEKSVESWAQPVESRPHGSKFNRVKIQFYTGHEFFDIYILTLSAYSPPFEIKTQWNGITCTQLTSHKTPPSKTIHNQLRPLPRSHFFVISYAFSSKCAPMTILWAFPDLHL